MELRRKAGLKKKSHTRYLLRCKGKIIPLYEKNAEADKK
jgi:hypothetical protein